MDAGTVPGDQGFGYLMSMTKRFQAEEIKMCMWKSTEDGFRWEGYGSRRLADGTPNRKAYYRCVNVRSTHSCQAKKVVQEHPDDDRVVMVIYKGQHSHPPVKPADQLHPILQYLHATVVAEPNADTTTLSKRAAQRHTQAHRGTAATPSSPASQSLPTPHPSLTLPNTTTVPSISSSPAFSSELYAQGLRPPLYDMHNPSKRTEPDSGGGALPAAKRVEAAGGPHQGAWPFSDAGGGSAGSVATGTQSQSSIELMRMLAMHASKDPSMVAALAAHSVALADQNTSVQPIAQPTAQLDQTFAPLADGIMAGSFDKTIFNSKEFMNLFESSELAKMFQGKGGSKTFESVEMQESLQKFFESYKSLGLGSMGKEAVAQESSGPPATRPSPTEPSTVPPSSSSTVATVMGDNVFARGLDSRSPDIQRAATPTSTHHGPQASYASHNPLLYSHLPPHRASSGQDFGMPPGPPVTSDLLLAQAAQRAAEGAVAVVAPQSESERMEAEAQKRQQAIASKLAFLTAAPASGE